MARDKIKRCVAIVKESTKVFYAIPILAAYPLIPVLFTTLLVVYAAVVAGFIYTQVCTCIRGTCASGAHMHVFTFPRSASP